MPRRMLHLKCVPTEYGGHRCYRVYPGFRGTYAADHGFLLYAGFGATVAEAYADFWRINCKFKPPHFLRLLTSWQQRDQDRRDNFVYAGGNMICPTCHKPYIQHKIDKVDPFLNVLCDGTRVKL